ncbi:MAG: ribonuclease H family protein, partial [Deltaproteobacteria bacterium]|nr:ribonuclease H family protein [Deltaproteobacteria bacterium]
MRFVTKYYAVKKGRQTGIFMKWPDCQRSVIGFSGADYKSFTTEREARLYLSGDNDYDDSDNDYVDSEKIKKFYAVKVGRNPGIFNSWHECQKAIAGSKYTVYKSFQSHQEAEDFLDGVTTNFYKDLIKEDLTKGYALAFCDGSFDKERFIYSFGVVAIGRDLKEVLISGTGDHPAYVSSRNVIGEILGALEA